MKSKNSINFMIGGPAGTGVASVGLLFARCLQRSGLYVFGTNDYPSLIKGGHNIYAISAREEPIYSLCGKPDILIALDKKTIEIRSGELSSGAALIYDANRIADAQALAGRQDIIYMGVPLTEMATKAGGEIMFNTVALGTAAGIVGVEFGVIESLMGRIWSKKGPKIVDANISAAKSGYDFTSKLKKSGFAKRIAKKKVDRKMLFMNGNEAAVAGAIAAGCKFVAEYPMSPSSAILHLMAGHERDYGIIVKQTEDEIAAANMIAGAAFAGARAMTATSGGGFSLMVEALGMMGIMEVPCVIFNSQRAGPSTGLPTYTDQSDLKFSLYASQGEFPRIVIAPGDVTECYVESFNAFNLAEMLQTPAIVLLDKYLSESSQTVEDFRSLGLKVERGMVLDDEELSDLSGPFKRYECTASGISPRCFPGQKNGMHVCSSYEHDETGFTSEDGKNRTAQIDKRARKMSNVPEEMIAPTFYGAERDSAEILMVCWGSTKGPAREALRMLQEKGASARLMHIRYASPFPAKTVLDELNGAKRAIIIEGNSEAQMRSHILEKTKYYIEETLLRYDARPFTPDEIASKVQEVLSKKGR